MVDDATLVALFGTVGTGALATLKRDGRPQISNVRYAFDPQTRSTRSFDLQFRDDQWKVCQAPAG